MGWGKGYHHHLYVESIQTGAPAEFYRNARAAGPLASFDAADNWVDHPYKDGVALIGDAAASDDPAYGEGLRSRFGDVRVLSDHLLAKADWEAAAHAYAEEHDHHYAVIHTVTRWFGDFFCRRSGSRRPPGTSVPADRSRSDACA